MFRAEKDPQAILDYSIDWTSWLGLDTIQTSTWMVPTGITKPSDSLVGALATVWLSGGTVGTSYIVTNRVVTAGGRTDERSITVRVIDK
jgi:hypothetical protein